MFLDSANLYSPATRDQLKVFTHLKGRFLAVGFLRVSRFIPLNHRVWNQSIHEITEFESHFCYKTKSPWFQGSGEQWSRYNLPRWLSLIPLIPLNQSPNKSWPQPARSGRPVIHWILPVDPRKSWLVGGAASAHLEKWWSSSMGFGWHPIYEMENMKIPLVGGVQNPSLIPFYWLVYGDFPIGLESPRYY